MRQDISSILAVAVIACLLVSAVNAESCKSNFERCETTPECCQGVCIMGKCRDMTKMCIPNGFRCTNHRQCCQSFCYGVKPGRYGYCGWSRRLYR